MRTLAKTLVTLLATAALAARPLVAAGPAERPLVMVFLVDHSESMKAFDPPDTTQAFLLHMINLAELAQQPVSIGVVFFGGDGVRVLADKDGRPTAAYATLRHDLVARWPKPAGATPMDAAFEAALKMVQAAPSDAQVGVILLSDGRPESGRLRPQDFREIAAEMTRRREAILQRYKGFPPAITQKFLQELENAWRTPGTEEFQQLFLRQLPLEYQRTLDHAAAIAKAKVRFVTVDFGGGLPELKEIHQAGGGAPGDLLVTHPNTILGKLQGLGLLSLPRVVLPPPQTLEADTASYQRRIDVPLDSIAAAALTSVEFRPAIRDFAAQASLKAQVSGAERPFSVANDDSDRLLAFDGQGAVATATLRLDTIPKEGKVTFRFESPSATLHAPACNVYTYLRLAAGVSAELRPAFAAPEAQPPFRVSPSQRARWTCALRVQNQPKPYAVRSIEAILRQPRLGLAVRLDLRPDPQSPGVFVTGETPVPAGSYDAELHVVLPSGATFTLLLPNHVQSQLKDEAITLDIPQPAGAADEAASLARGHLDFGPLGDRVTGKAIVVAIRSLGIDEPITVIPSVTLTDPQGTVPQSSWITFDKPKLVLQPGRVEKLRLTATVPKQIEEAIQDGRFEGKLALLTGDNQQPIALRRFAKISGVDDSEPVERVTFTLARPQMRITAPYALRNRLRTSSDGTIHLPIAVSIGQPLRRTVTVSISHDSVVPREFTMVPSAIFVDTDGRQVPSIRLLPLPANDVRREILVGHTASWDFQFGMDQDCPTSKAQGTIDITAPGLAPLHVAVLVERRQPLLASTIRFLCAIVAGVCLLLAIRAGARRWRDRTLRSGAQLTLTPAKPHRGGLAVAAGRKDHVQITAEEPMKIARRGDSTPLLIPAGCPYTLDGRSITPTDPVVVEMVGSGEEQARCLELTECVLDDDGQPELSVEVVCGGAADQEGSRHAQSVRKNFALAAACGALACTLNYAPVLTAVQWVYDVFHVCQ